jgi:predicted O-methyltransferase YrrM
VAGIKEEAVTRYPLGMLRVIVQESGEEQIGEIGTSHGTSGMSGLGFFYHSSYQDTHVVGCSFHQD